MSNDNIKVYKVELEAHNVSPEQRDLIYSSLDKAFDVILKSELTGEDQYLCLGETKVSEDYPLGDSVTTQESYEELRGLV
jgi:hypothetical protein